MRGAPALSDRHGGVGGDEPDTPPALPMRATWIVLSVWVFALVIIALVVVPLLFATCLPSPAPPSAP